MGQGVGFRVFRVGVQGRSLGSLQDPGKVKAIITQGLEFRVALSVTVA